MTEDFPTWDAIVESARGDGIFMNDPVEFIDGLAVGLTIAFWRNTELENVHSGERGHGMSKREYSRLSQLPYAPGQVDAERTRSVLEGIEHGLGIPDDIMMRANTHTSFSVRQVLGAHLPKDSIQGIREALTSGHTWFSAALSTLLDPDRPVRIGAIEIQAAELLGNEFATFQNDVDDIADRHTAIATGLGWDIYAVLLVYFAGTYGGAWFPSPMWPEVIKRYRESSTDLPANYFDTLTRTPWRLEYEEAGRFIRDNAGDVLYDIRRERSDPAAKQDGSQMAGWLLI